MSKPIKLFFLGVTIGLLALGVGYISSQRNVSKLNELVEKCNAEVMQAPQGPWLNWQKAPLVCDPSELYSVRTNELKGIQKEIAEFDLSRNDLFEASKIIAIFSVIVFSLPYIWYFFLRRVRELRDVISGK